MSMRASAIGLVDEEEKTSVAGLLPANVILCTNSSGSQRIGRSHCCQTGSGAYWCQLTWARMPHWLHRSMVSNFFGCWWASCSHIVTESFPRRELLSTRSCAAYLHDWYSWSRTAWHALRYSSGTQDLFCKWVRIVCRDTSPNYLSTTHGPIATEDNLNVIDVMNWIRFPEFWCET